MLRENLKTMRKAKGLSQEALATRINVVRQTVSKWEKGLSVPDAEMLIALADVLDTTVSALLGDPIAVSTDNNAIGQQLEQRNAMLAEKTRRSRRIWKAAAVVLIFFVAMMVFLMVMNMMPLRAPYSESTVEPAAIASGIIQDIMK